MNDNDFLKYALVEAKKAYKKKEVPVGAVIVKKGKIIARAYNKIEILNDSTAHAEILAIRKAGKKLKNWRLNDCILYSTIEPCPMCELAIQQARIKKVVFGCKRIEKEKLPPIIKKQIEKKKCKTILKKFFTNLRRNQLT